MSQEQFIVGLDIGTSKICALVGKRLPDGKVQIVGLGKVPSLGVSRGVVSNIDRTVQGIREAVALAEEMAGMKIEKVNVGIAGQHIHCIQHNGLITRDPEQSRDSEIVQEDLDKLEEQMHKIVLPPGEEIIHVLNQGYTVDGIPLSGAEHPVGMSGVRIEGSFHIVTGHVSAIQNIYRCVEKAGLQVTGLTLEPIASAEAVLDHEEREGGVVLVDIGGGTTDIAIIHENIIKHTAVIPFGGDIITEDIREGCSIMKPQAEKLKVEYGSAIAYDRLENEIIAISGFRGQSSKEVSRKNLGAIIQARLEEIFEQVAYEIRISHLEKKLIAGAVLTGGGSQLKYCKQLFELVTGQAARIGIPGENLSPDVPDTVREPMYSTGIGLILQGFKVADEMARTGSQPAQAGKSETVKPQGRNIWDVLIGKGMELMGSKEFNDTKL